MAIPTDICRPCLNCTNCSGFQLHQWRSRCAECFCDVNSHDLNDDRVTTCISSLGLDEQSLYKDYQSALNLAKQFNCHWIPVGLQEENEVNSFLDSSHSDVLALCKADESNRTKRIHAFRKQIPIVDRSAPDMRMVRSDLEKSEAAHFLKMRNNKVVGIGFVEKLHSAEECQTCHNNVAMEEFCVRLRPEHAKTQLGWHSHCFRCSHCEEPLVDYIYCWHNDKLFCERHFAQMIRPRCVTCDELIFTEEYTKAMEQDHHTEHFACKNCDKSLTGQRYILKDEHPYCLQCYEDVFANACEHCKEKIGCDSKDLSFKERHWHEKCFNCSACSNTLVDRPFATRDEALFCSDCYDEKFAARCDACNKVFKAGMRKFEYRGKQWHEECFTCAECTQPIGSKSFIPRDQQVVCVPCYEGKYAQRCTKCQEVIRRGGVTYKSEPWHKECFTCTHCSKQLAGIKFISKDEKPYCADCYGDLFAKKCCKCTKPITGIGGCKFISFEDRHWHSECFNCSKCDVNLVGKGFLTTDDQITCPDCGR